MDWEYKIALGCGEVIHGKIIEFNERGLAMLTDSEEFNVISITWDCFPGNWVKL